MNVFECVYQQVAASEQLPWHRREPPILLKQALAHQARGRALDIGCGAGIQSVYLAQHGWQVTAVDFVSRALDFARQEARHAGVSIHFIEADVLDFKAVEPFDLVLDAGCFDSLSADQRFRYRRLLLDSWLADDGDYILAHFGKRHRLDYRPFGPRRRSRFDVLANFSPELHEHAYLDYLIRAPFPVGPKILLGEYWLRRFRPFSGHRITTSENPGKVDKR